jgi:hypothetical protein
VASELPPPQSIQQIACKLANAFDRWWQEWASRNERLVAGVAVSEVFEQRRREIAAVERWARTHIEFWFGSGDVNDGSSNSGSNTNSTNEGESGS